MIVPTNVKTVVACTSYEEMLQNKWFFMTSFSSILDDFYQEVRSKKPEIFPEENQLIEVNQEKYLQIFSSILRWWELSIPEYEVFESLISNSVFDMCARRFLTENISFEKGDIRASDYFFLKDVLVYVLKQAVTSSVAQTLDTQGSQEYRVFQNDTFQVFTVGTRFLVKQNHDIFYADEFTVLSPEYFAVVIWKETFVYAQRDGKLVWQSWDRKVRTLVGNGVYIVSDTEAYRRNAMTQVFDEKFQLLKELPWFQEDRQAWNGIYNSFEVIDGYIVHTISVLWSNGEISDREKSVLFAWKQKLQLQKEAGFFVGTLWDTVFKIRSQEIIETQRRAITNI